MRIPSDPRGGSRHSLPDVSELANPKVQELFPFKGLVTGLMRFFIPSKTESYFYFFVGPFCTRRSTWRVDVCVDPVLNHPAQSRTGRHTNTSHRTTYVF